MQSFLPIKRRALLNSGLIALLGLGLTLFINLYFPLSFKAHQNLWLIIIGLILTSATYHAALNLYPSLQEKDPSIVPNIFYVILIGLAALATGPNAHYFTIFFLVVAAIEAFILPIEKFFLLGVVILASLSFQFLTGECVQTVIGILGVVILSVAMRVINYEATKIKDREITLSEDIQKLEDDKREIRTLLEAIGDGMFVVDSRNKITFLNKSALKILRIIAPKEKILGRDINDFLPTIGKKGPEPVTRDVFGNYKNSIRNDLRIVRADRVIRLHTNTTPVISEKGKIQGAIIFFRDITAEKRLDEERSEFNAVASHELRTPLTVLEGYLYFILDPDSGAKYDKVTKEYIEKAHDASKDLIHLVSDILTVVKSEDNDLIVTLEKVSPKEVIEKILKSLQGKATAKKIKIKFEETAAKPIPKITTDKVKVKEIITNLVDNAIKFTEKGEIKVELGILESEVIISVIDTGPGIEESEQKMVFQKFFRSENYKTRKTGGTGLGLYIVKTLTERLGGRVGLQSVPGKGSRFYFTLPLNYQKQSNLISTKENKESAILK